LPSHHELTAEDGLGVSFRDQLQHVLLYLVFAVVPAFGAARPDPRLQILFAHALLP
jgi:hypothetical protein